VTLPRTRSFFASDDVAHRHVVIKPSVLYFGTPVSLISTLNEDGSANPAPMSSSWYLGDTIVLGIGDSGQTILNLRREPGFVLNLPSAAQHAAVEWLAPLTGRHPLPEAKRARFRYEPATFAAAGLTEQASDLVRAPRVAECPVQLEAIVQALHPPVVHDRRGPRAAAPR
jgi:flavin reductase (DIM6/NTAB) family NADH-FMN oxidoreductase RutF